MRALTWRAGCLGSGHRLSEDEVESIEAALTRNRENYLHLLISPMGVYVRQQF